MNTDAGEVGRPVGTRDGADDEEAHRQRPRSGGSRTDFDQLRERVLNKPGFKPRSGLPVGELILGIFGRSGKDSEKR